MPSKASNLAGFASSISSNNNLNVGIVTASGFVGNVTGNLTGNVTGNATGLSGTPNLNVGVVTASGFVGNLTGNATGLSGSPNVTVGFATITNFLKSTETRLVTGSEKVFRTDGNTINLIYNSSTSSNIGYTTNPTADITLNVTNIPTTSDFDDHSITFAVIVNSTGTARTCTSVTLNGVSKTIRWIGGSLASAITGVTTTTGHTFYNFTGINTVGSASTTSNYEIFGIVSGGFW